MWQLLTDQFDRTSWNAFVKTYGPVSGRFLQSWEWGDLQVAQRWVMDQKGVANVIRKKAPWVGAYAYCPRGPVVEGEVLEATEALAGSQKDIIFFRTDFSKFKIQDLTPVQKTIDVQPAHTWITDLRATSDLLFSDMHPKTRYNIKLAERHGVQISLDTLTFDDVWPLFESTSKRGVFRLHAKHYYKKMLDELHKSDCRAFLATALYKDEPIAANIMIDFAGVRTYLHGASSYAHRSLMAPHLLHWFLLKDACKQGMSHYDWWGIAPSRDSNHPWSGITRFKKSFPGQELIYPGTYDLVKRPLRYKLYQLARRLRRAMR